MKDELLPPLRVMWSLLWRSVVFFPLVALVHCLIFAVWFLLLGWGVCYALMGQWLQAAGCGVGFAAITAAVRWWLRRKSGDTR